MTQLDRALILYAKLIDSFASKPSGHLFLLGDPLLESARFYSFPDLPDSFKYDQANEMRSDQVDYIEELLMEYDASYSLIQPLSSKLREVSPIFNALGFSVFVGSWGMGPEEIGWWIRHLNDRARFDEYLAITGTDESAINQMNSVCSDQLMKE